MHVHCTLISFPHTISKVGMQVMLQLDKRYIFMAQASPGKKLWARQSLNSLRYPARAMYALICLPPYSL